MGWMGRPTPAPGTKSEQPAYWALDLVASIGPTFALATVPVEEQWEGATLDLACILDDVAATCRQLLELAPASAAELQKTPFATVASFRTVVMADIARLELLISSAKREDALVCLQRVLARIVSGGQADDIVGLRQSGDAFWNTAAAMLAEVPARRPA